MTNAGRSPRYRGAIVFGCAHAGHVDGLYGAERFALTNGQVAFQSGFNTNGQVVGWGQYPAGGRRHLHGRRPAL